MSRFRVAKVEETITPNLIPMIDIMFLMLLFFMLGADMSQRELADVKLPKADQAQETEKVKGEVTVTTVNVLHRMERGNVSCADYLAGKICRDETHWLYSIRAKEFTKEQIWERLKFEANLELEDQVDPQAGKKLSKRKIMIRADRYAPYGHIQQVLTGCALAGIYKIELTAAMPSEKK